MLILLSVPLRLTREYLDDVLVAVVLVVALTAGLCTSRAAHASEHPPPGSAWLRIIREAGWDTFMQRPSHR